MRKLFGTDGIRGIANKDPLTIDVCLKLSQALFQKINKKNKEKHMIIIGKDTRISGDIFEHALAASFASLGVEVNLIGVCPTPAISVLTKELDADFGIMISASHNPFYDNGIKIFANNGLKLTDDEESELELLMEKSQKNNADHNDNSKSEKNIFGEKVGRIKTAHQFLNIYIERIKKLFSFNPAETKKIKIVLDSSNGSFSAIASDLLKEFGFNVISLFDSPNGININEKCGVTNPETISSAVLENHADIGIAFDGDGDRLLMCDASGKLLSGEYILAILAEQFGLKDTEIVSTIMANFGFQKYLENKNIKLVRTKVGDRYISEYMRTSSDIILGGEPSGHIIIREHALTGDGFFAALKILEYVISSGKKLQNFFDLFKLYPCANKNVKVKDKNIICDEKIIEVIKKYEEQLNGRGKLIVRASGTEPLIRISAEGESKSELENIVNSLSDLITESE